MQYTPFELALIKSRTSICRDPKVAFFSAVLLQTPIKIDNSIAFGATNGKEIFLNEERFIDLNTEERKFLLLHKTLHIVYLHTKRIQEREPILWNCATDFVINLYLTEQGYNMIAGGLLDRQYINQSSEQVYKALEQNTEKQSILSNFSDDLMDIIPNDESIVELEKYHKELMVKSKAIAEMNHNTVGELPKDIKRLLQDISQPRLNWQAILRRFLSEASKADYTWLKPNLNYLHYGIHIPSLHSEGLSMLDLSIDTSGSISDKEFNIFINEIAGIIKQFNPEEIGILQFDCVVHNYTTVKTLNQLQKLKIVGGGGTDIYPVLEYTNKTNSKAVIILTDGYFDYTKIRTNKPIIWCVYDNENFKPSIGTVVHFNLDNIK